MEMAQVPMAMEREGEWAATDGDTSNMVCTSNTLLTGKVDQNLQGSLREYSDALDIPQDGAESALATMAKDMKTCPRDGSEVDGKCHDMDMADTTEVQDSIYTL